MRLNAAAALIFGLLSMSAARGGGLTDSLDTSSSDSVTAHHFTSTGEVVSRTVGDFVGGHDMRRIAHIVRGKDSSVSYTLRVTPNEPITIEIEEICSREHDVRANLVFIDGHKTYLRTWEGNGAGPLHYFLQAPATTRDHVTVKLQNLADAEFGIGRIWAFSNFDSYLDDNHLYVPFHLAPTVHLKWDDFDTDLATVLRLKESFADHKNARPAFTAWIAYAQWSDEQIEANVQHLLKLADRAQVPVQISFDSWWGNTPTGKWWQEKYQQVVWNETKKRMQLSVPNQWSNTPWLSINEPELNAFKRERLASAIRIFRRQYAAMRAAGKHNLILAINLDNEPIYWASGNAGLGGDELWADFSACAIADAAKAGVKLDPRDGLSREERLWLWCNLRSYQEMIGSCVVENLGDEPIGSDSRDLLRNNVFTQAMLMSRPAMQYPMFDAGYPLWEHGAPASVRCGGEWNGNSVGEIESVLHQLPLGRNAATNAECGNDAREVRSVAPAYALGQRYDALYNYPLDQLRAAAAELDDLSRPLAPFLHEPILFEHDFGSDAWKLRVTSSSNIAVSRLVNTSILAAHPATSNAPGVLEYDVRAPGESFDGLALELCGRAFVNHRRDPRVNISVLAGEPLREIRTIHDAEDLKDVHHIDLSAAARGKSKVSVRIDLNGARESLDWVAIDHIRFTTPWHGNLTADLPAQDTSLRTLRRQNLLVSWRADAELEMAKLPANQREGAAKLYDRGAYREAYESACQIAHALAAKN